MLLYSSTAAVSYTSLLRNEPERGMIYRYRHKLRLYDITLPIWWGEKSYVKLNNLSKDERESGEHKFAGVIKNTICTPDLRERPVKEYYCSSTAVQ